MVIEDINNSISMIDICTFEAIKRTFDKMQLDIPHKEQAVNNAIKLLTLILQHNEKIIKKTVAHLMNLIHYDNILTLCPHNSNALESMLQFTNINESIRIFITVLIWSEIPLNSYLEKLIFKSGGGGRQDDTSFGILVIQECLEIGLSYKNHQELFDRILKANKKRKALIFPRARYPSHCIRKNKSDIVLLLSKGKHGHLYERSIPELTHIILDRIERNNPGIYPFFSKTRSGKKEFLCALIIKENEAFFYLKNLNKYFEFERSIYECNTSCNCR